MLITGLKESSPGKYILQTDSGAEIITTLEVAADERLYVGMELDEELFERIKTESAKYTALKKSYELISLRMMSGKELKDKLMHKGYEEESADFAVSRLYELGILNDEEYAAAIVRHYSAKGYGAARIKAELGRRGINRELLEEQLELMPSQDDKLDRFISSRLKDPDDKDQQKKVAAALARRGYSWDEIRSAMQRFTTTEEF